MTLDPHALKIYHRWIIAEESGWGKRLRWHCRASDRLGFKTINAGAKTVATSPLLVAVPLPTVAD